MHLHVQTHHLRDADVVHLVGAIDASNFPSLLATLNERLQSSLPQIVLECSHVRYIGSAELKALLELAHIARARGGDIKCAQLPPTIEQVATLLANGDPLECFPDVHEALAAFCKSGVTA